MSKAEKLIAKGRSLEAKGKLDKALDVFREATKVDPVDPEAWQARGELAARIGAPREAAESLFRVADMYARAGMPREALRLVVRVIELDPLHDGAKRFRRMLESKSGEHAAVEPPAGPGPGVASGTKPVPTVPDGPPVPAPPVLPDAAAPPARVASVTEAKPVSSEAAAPRRRPTAELVVVEAPEAASAPEAIEAELPPEVPLRDPEPNGAHARAGSASDAAPRTIELVAEPNGAHARAGSASDVVPRTIELVADEPDAESPEPAFTPAESSAPSAPFLAASELPLGAGARAVMDGGVAHEFSMGRTTGEMALESSISLADHLSPSSQGGGHTEFSLDDEPKLDVVHAVASAIGSSPLLSELDSDLVKHLIDAGTLTRRPAGESVFRQGDVGTSLFLILAGEVAVVRDVAGEPPRELARLRAGAFFGEMALITNSSRSATVRVEKAADLLEVSRRAVRSMIEKEPRVLKLLMRFFRARLVGTLLQTSPVFEPFSREDRKKLVAAFRLRELGAGHAVFEEGSKAEGLFVLLAGRLEVLKGLDKVLGQLSPGDVFGEMSLLDGSVAMATVRAKTRSWVLLLPRNGFEDLASRYPQIRGQLRALADTRRARNERELHTPTPGGHREGRVEPV